MPAPDRGRLRADLLEVGVGVRTGSATRTSSTSTCRTCGASSTASPRTCGSCTPCAASGSDQQRTARCRRGPRQHRHPRHGAQRHRHRRPGRRTAHGLTVHPFLADVANIDQRFARCRRGGLPAFGDDLQPSESPRPLRCPPSLLEYGPAQATMRCRLVPTTSSAGAALMSPQPVTATAARHRQQLDRHRLGRHDRR